MSTILIIILVLILVGAFRLGDTAAAGLWARRHRRRPADRGDRSGFDRPHMIPRTWSANRGDWINPLGGADGKRDVSSGRGAPLPGLFRMRMAPRCGWASHPPHPPVALGAGRGCGAVRGRISLTDEEVAHVQETGWPQDVHFPSLPRLRGGRRGAAPCAPARAGRKEGYDRTSVVHSVRASAGSAFLRARTGARVRPAALTWTRFLDTPPPGEEDGEAARVRAALARVLASDEFSSSPRLATSALCGGGQARRAGGGDQGLYHRRRGSSGGRLHSIRRANHHSCGWRPPPAPRWSGTILCGLVDDEMEIVIPKGSYVPHFRPRGAAAEVLPKGAASDRRGRHPRRCAASRRKRPAALGRFRRWCWFLLLMWARWACVPSRVHGRSRACSRKPKGRVILPTGSACRSSTCAPSRRGAAVRPRRPRPTHRGPPAGCVSPASISWTSWSRGRKPRCGNAAIRRRAQCSPCRGSQRAGEDGTFSLLVRLSDRCEGTIVWSADFEGSAPGLRHAGPPSSGWCATSPSRSCSPMACCRRARGRRPRRCEPLGFGCIAQVYSLSRGSEGGNPARGARVSRPRGAAAHRFGLAMR